MVMYDSRNNSFTVIKMCRNIDERIKDNFIYFWCFDFLKFSLIFRSFFIFSGILILGSSFG
jgi:hypothetical protein